MPMNAHLRIARSTDQMEAIVAMYKDGLSLDIIGSLKITRALMMSC
jgi:YycE-like N-terminal domain